MRVSRVPWTRTRSRPKETRFHPSLVRNLLIFVLLFSFLPLILVGILNTFHSRTRLRSQISQQIETIALHEAGYLDQFVDLRGNMLDSLITNHNFNDQILTLLQSPDSDQDYSGGQSFLNESLRSNPQVEANDYIDQLAVLAPNGKMLLTTDSQWATAGMGERAYQDSGIQELIGQNRSYFFFDKVDNRASLFTARSFVDEQGKPAATVFSSSPAEQTLRSLAGSSTLIPGAINYFFDRAGQLFRFNDQGELSRVEQPEVTARIAPLFGPEPAQTLFSSELKDRTPVIAFAQWLPQYNIGILLAVPERAVFDQSVLFDPFNLILLGSAFILTGGLLFLGSIYLVNPFLQLTEAVNLFTKGHWKERARIDRNDEIGLLANSFNQMADQLSNHYQLQEGANETLGPTNEVDHLLQAARKMARARSEDEIIQVLADTFIQLPYPGSVFSVEAENLKILFIADPKTGQIERNLQNIEIPLGRIGELLLKIQAQYIEDISQPNDYEKMLSPFHERGCKSAVLLAILSGGQLSKVIVLGARNMDQITNASILSYVNLAEVIGATQEKIRVLETLQHRLSELQILAKLNQSISVETDPNHLYRVLHEEINLTFGTDLDFAVALFDPARNQIEFPYCYEKGKRVALPSIPFGSGLTSTLLQSRRAILLSDEQAVQARSAVQVGKPAKSWMGIPLIFAGDTLGAVILQDLEKENRFSQDDVNLLTTLSPQIAIAVRNAQLYTQTQQAMQAYDQERFLLNTLLENMPEGISFKDAGGKYIRASQSIANLYHVPPEGLIGKTDLDFIDPESAAVLRENEERVLNSGIAEIGMIEPIMAPDGQEGWIFTSRIPIRLPSGDSSGLLIIQQDVSELKQAEALAQSRADQLTSAAEIAREATGTLDLKALLSKAVYLVLERFNFYQVSIYLIDPDGEYAVLREVTGEAGQQMLQAGHKLAIGSRSIVGQVCASGEAQIINDVAHNLMYFPNSLLPDTHSELAIPLMVGERVLGALDVQSSQVDAFKSEEVSALRILADQLAVALVNGELFAKTQDLLGKHRLLRQVSIAASTSTNLEDALTNVVRGLLMARVGERIAIYMVNEEGYLQIRASAGYEGTRHLDLRLAPGQGITGQTAAEKRPIRVDNTLSDHRYVDVDHEIRSELAIPILFNEELMGVLNLQSTHIAAFDENDLEILGALGNNLGAVIANIRLVNQIRKQVTRERQLFEITSKIRRSVEIESILETSTQEICRVLGARRAKIHITAGTSLFEPGDHSGFNDQSGPPDSGNGHNKFLRSK